MCSYDDMEVSPTVKVTQSVARTNCKLPQNFFSILKKSYLKILKHLESARLVVILFLLLVPVSGSPLPPSRKSSRSAFSPITQPSPLRHSHRGHPKVGIGIEQPIQGDILSLHPDLFLHHILSSYPRARSSSLTKGSFQNYKNTLEIVGTEGKNLLPQNILRGPEDPTYLVPKPSGVRPGALEESTRSRWRTQSSQFAMEEVESVPVGRERRATAETPSRGAGRGEWMEPCPNLDSAVDENATPQSLSELIVRAINEAKSQVDKFINDFARETFHVDTWLESFPEHEGFSLPFLKNSSGIDLSTPEGVSFAQALQEAYELMQRRAVGIEQVTLDQALYQAKFLPEFRHVEDRIVHVLCELRHAMIQSGVAPKQAVTKDVMEEESRDMDGERKRNIRDAVILREYVAGLETLHALFNYYASKRQ